MSCKENSQQLTYKIRLGELAERYRASGGSPLIAESNRRGQEQPIGHDRLHGFEVFTHGLGPRSVGEKDIQPEESGMEDSFHITYPLGKHELFTDYYEEFYRLIYQLEELEKQKTALAYFESTARGDKDTEKTKAICKGFYSLKCEKIPSKINSILRSVFMTYKKLMAGQYPILHPILSLKERNACGRKKDYYDNRERNTKLKNLFGIDRLDWIQTDGKNYYSLLPPSEALAKLEKFMAKAFDEEWTELLELEAYAQALALTSIVGYSIKDGYLWGDPDLDPQRCNIPIDQRVILDLVNDYSGRHAYEEEAFCLNFRSSLDFFNSKFASDVRETIKDELKSFNEYQKRAKPLYAKYDQLASTLLERLKEINSEDYFLSVVESVNEAIAAEEERKRLELEKQRLERLEKKRLEEEAAEKAAEKARIEKAEKHKVWLTGFATRKQAVRDTGKCGCTDRNDKPKDNYPTKADAYEVAAKRMKKAEALELDVYECPRGERDSYERFHEYDGWHLTSKAV